jgi:hypothetical protein
MVCSSIVLTKRSSDIVPARPLLGSIEALGVSDQFLHAVAVRNKSARNIRLRPIRFGELPNRVHRIFCSQHSLVYPFNWGRKLRWIIPIKIFCEPKSEIVAELYQDAKNLEAADRGSLLIGTAQVEHETTIWFQFAENPGGEAANHST